jgi:hypothetical protein
MTNYTELNFYDRTRVDAIVAGTADQFPHGCTQSTLESYLPNLVPDVIVPTDLVVIIHERLREVVLDREEARRQRRRAMLDAILSWGDEG